MTDSSLEDIFAIFRLAPKCLPSQPPVHFLSRSLSLLPRLTLPLLLTRLTGGQEAYDQLFRSLTERRGEAHTGAYGP